MTEFNSYANPKVETKRFKIYADVSEGSGNPEWELQGRGVGSWTVDENEDITKEPDVLGYIDMERGTPQQTQTGVIVNLRKGSKFGSLLFDAWFTGDKSKLDAMKFLQKFEFVDGTDENTCRARLEEDVLVSINSFNGEAAGYLSFDIDIHYANMRTIGTMPKVDGDEITFTPDSAA